eukprot:gene4526-7904_t
MRPSRRQQKVPEFLNQTPWYSNSNIEPDEGQEKKKEKKWYQRGVKGETATTYRKGACTNCGAMTHKTKDCMERPRKRGAKLTGKDIKPDEIITDVGELTYEEKRDAWNGYEVENYDEVYKSFEEDDLEKRKQKVEVLEKKFMTEPDPEQKRFPTDSLLDNSKTTEEAEKKINLRGLRNREDTAKYLLNLDPESAEYDPKTRSMRGNPLPDDPTSEFQGDGRASREGFYNEFKTIQKFAWESTEEGKNVILQASPSQAEQLHREFMDKKKKMEIEKLKKLNEKYGLEETKELPKELAVGQTELYFEYSGGGDVVGGKKMIMPKSVFEEDVFPNGHSSVWGSFYKKGEWGYSCCHQLEYDSVCSFDNKKRKIIEDVPVEELKKQKQE